MPVLRSGIVPAPVIGKRRFEMDRLQQRIIEIAQQIPEYVGYQAKDMRRESDKLVRRQLAAKYDELRVRLARLQRNAPLDRVVALENLDQKLQRLIARLNTAPGGYAGWFDAGQIVETDLDQLMEFDGTLTQGVEQLKATFDQVARAMKAQAKVDEAVEACAETLDTLNAQFDEREQFLAMGRRPTPLSPSSPAPSPLQALEPNIAPAMSLVNLAALKVNDAVTYAGTDYLVGGKITYAVAAGSFWAFLLQDRNEKRWLRVGPRGELSLCQEVELAVTSPWPDSLAIQGDSYKLEESGSAQVIVEGAGGVRRGTSAYSRYASGKQKRLWVEEFGETRAMAGSILESEELTVFQR